ncbi:MAG: pantoate--beta-alanine ligase [Gammaproteobacteria bacterium]
MLPPVAGNVAELRKLVGGREVALTATMGALHEGHLSLIRTARNLAAANVASIYVNPKQFGAGEDFDSYPRDLSADREKLRGLADVVFAPASLYPENQTVHISLPPVAEELCGKFRPEFFAGVSLAVCKLFNCVRPKAAVFGKKDFQQLHIVRLLARQLQYPIEIVAGETAREADGLAHSSRNVYLSAAERKLAPLLPRTLREAAENIDKGAPPKTEAAAAAESLRRGGFNVEYAEARDYDTLGAPGGGRIVLLAAAFLGKTRLIDNMECRTPRG